MSENEVRPIETVEMDRFGACEDGRFSHSWMKKGRHKALAIWEEFLHPSRSSRR
jgi:hypothetical protein